ncbi:hypothetical protein JIN85_02270 [Luteolibacter pohnpeiensis]|uniref:Uncharacterized protein n=1 Tax=Luteolibacter pohnpeiensis TaxID=454153 RepID=A0A934S4S4_9BACT|nr:hypothetical protein [Luteolibacter pohnpeiensis]
MWKRFIWILVVAGIAGLFVIPLNPVNSKILKLAYLICIAVTWSGCTILGWKHKTLRTAALLLPFLAVILLFLPSREIDPGELRQSYVRRMTEFERTKYFGSTPKIGDEAFC